MIMIKEKYKITEHTYLGSDLVDLNKVLPISGNVASLNLLFTPKTNKISEPGIYSIFFDDMLLYIGKYQGKSKDPFGGCVNRDRWCKHLATLTLRGKKVSCSLTTLINLENDIRNNSKLKVAYDEIFGQFNRDVFVGDRGFVTVYPRVRFAMDKWSIFKNLTSDDLSRFKFHYISFSHDNDMETLTYREVISFLEEKLIEHFHPILNVKGKDPAKTKNIDIIRYKEFLNNNFSLEENKDKVKLALNNSRFEYNEDVSDFEKNNLNLFLNKMERNHINSKFIDEIIDYLDSYTTLDYYFTDIPDFRISGVIGKYKNGKIVKRVLTTIKILKIKKQVKFNVLLPIQCLDQSLLRFSRVVKNTLSTEIAIPFSDLNNNLDLLIKVLVSVQKYHDL